MAAVIITKADQILTFLTIKFCKEIQIKWYDEGFQVYTHIECLEQQMREVEAD